MGTPDDACPLQVHVACQGTVQIMYTCTLQVYAARAQQGGKDQEDRKLVYGPLTCLAGNKIQLQIVSK